MPRIARIARESEIRDLREIRDRKAVTRAGGWDPPECTPGSRPDTEA